MVPIKTSFEGDVEYIRRNRNRRLVDKTPYSEKEEAGKT
jgi:hypothetical protein